MDPVKVDQKSYEMPPKDGFTVAHFIVVADIERSVRFYEKIFFGAAHSGAEATPPAHRGTCRWQTAGSSSEIVGGGPTLTNQLSRSVLPQTLTK